MRLSQVKSATETGELTYHHSQSLPRGVSVLPSSPTSPGSLPRLTNLLARTSCSPLSSKPFVPRTLDIYFEKHRIFDGKPKTASRLNSEAEFPGGRPLEQQRYGYFPTASGKMTRRKIK